MKWLGSIEVNCNEIFGNFSNPEAEALYRAFVARKKRRLNRVFDAINFFYPDYPYAVHETKKRKKQMSKVTTKRRKITKVKSEATASQASERHQ